MSHNSFSPQQIAVVAVSGPIRAGKTTLSHALCAASHGTRLSTRDVLEELRDGAADRRELQAFGRYLDELTAGRWVFEAAQRIATPDETTLLVIDAVRILAQVEAVRSEFPTLHIHLTAPLGVLEQRWKHSNLETRLTYSELRADPTEAQIETLSTSADLVIDTAVHPADETARLATTHMRFASLRD